MSNENAVVSKLADMVSIMYHDSHDGCRFGHLCEDPLRNEYNPAYCVACQSCFRRNFCQLYWDLNLLLRI